MEAARLHVTVGADTRSAEAALSSFDQKLKSVAGSMTKTGAAMTLGLTTPLVAAAKSALGMAADYEQSMNVLQVSIGATDKQMAKMSDRAMQLGAETSFSAGEAAEGMLELGKAGMNATQIYDAMPGVLALAAAGQISVAEASAVTASTLNAFGLEAAESTRIADLLAGAANASQANISDLSQGMQQAGFAFKLANQPVEYLAASLALLTDQGLTGSDAGTALKNAFMRMVNPTGEATAVMDKLGISFYDANGNMRQLPDIIGIINSATEGLTNQQRDAALATIFLSDGMKAIIPLLDAGAEGFNKTVDTVTEVGAASKISDALMKGLAGGLESLSSSVETFLLGAGLPFTETLGDWARALGDAITAFGNLPPDVLNLALGILAVVAAAGPAILIVGTLAGALSAIGLTAGLAILGVAGLAVAWGMNLGGIRDKTAEVVPAIQEWFSGLSTDVAAVATAISTAFSNTTFPTLDELWQQFKTGDFEAVASTIRDTAYELMVNLNTELKITGTIDALKTKLQGFVSQLTADVSALDFGAAGSKIAEKINGLTGAINELDLSGIDWVGVLTRVLLGPLGTAIGALKWALEPGQLSALVDAVKGAIGTIAWGDLGTAFGGLSVSIVAQLIKVGQDIIRDFKAAFPTVPTTPTAKEVAKVAAPEPVKGRDFDWEAVGAAPAKMIKAMIDSVVNFDWATAGAGVGAAIGLWFAGEMAKVKFFQDNPTLITDFNSSWTEFQKQIGAEMRAGWDEAIGEDPFGRLAEGIRTGWSEFIEGLVSTLMGAFVRPKNEPASVSDTLRGTEEPPLFQWSDYIKPLEWAGIVEKFAWADYITSIDWASYVGSMSWDEFITALSWFNFITTVNWGSYIASLAWGSFVPDINWESYVPSFGWGDFIPALDWTRFVSWLNIPGNAAGTNNWRGGWTVVGEEGPEVVNLPRGSQIYNNQETEAMLGGRGINVTVNASIANDMDVESIALRVAKIIARRTR